MEVLFAKGTSKAAFPIKLIYIKRDSPSDSLVKAMFVVPKRNFKRANERNKLKRRMKEVYRTSKEGLYDSLRSKEIYLELAFLYVGKEAESYLTIHEKLTKLLSFLTEEINLRK